LALVTEDEGTANNMIRGIAQEIKQAEKTNLDARYFDLFFLLSRNSKGDSKDEKRKVRIRLEGNWIKQREKKEPEDALCGKACLLSIVSI
jgi:hypothetical protein